MPAKPQRPLRPRGSHASVRKTTEASGAAAGVGAPSPKKPQRSVPPQKPQRSARPRGRPRAKTTEACPAAKPQRPVAPHPREITEACRHASATHARAGAPRLPARAGGRWVRPLPPVRVRSGWDHENAPARRTVRGQTGGMPRRGRSSVECCPVSVASRGYAVSASTASAASAAAVSSAVAFGANEESRTIR